MTFRKVHHGELKMSKVDWSLVGVHFDRSLTLKPRLQYTKTRCLKALILFKVTAACSLDADCDAKLMQYSALVVSKLDYGSNV